MSRRTRNEQNVLKKVYSEPHTWIHNRVGKVLCSILDLMKRYPQYGLKRDNLLGLLKGWKKETQGWTLYEY